jgi:hypothetical protein
LKKLVPLGQHFAPWFIYHTNIVINVNDLLLALVHWLKLAPYIVCSWTPITMFIINNVTNINILSTIHYIPPLILLCTHGLYGYIHIYMYVNGFLILVLRLTKLGDSKYCLNNKLCN